MCGGTAVADAENLDDRGLSPRVRGNLVVHAGLTEAQRSIPACAGEPPKPGTAPPLAMVYPRVCGGTP